MFLGALDGDLLHIVVDHDLDQLGKGGLGGVPAQLALGLLTLANFRHSSKSDNNYFRLPCVKGGENFNRAGKSYTHIVQKAVVAAATTAFHIILFLSVCERPRSQGACLPSAAQKICSPAPAFYSREALSSLHSRHAAFAALP